MGKTRVDRIRNYIRRSLNQDAIESKKNKKILNWFGYVSSRKIWLQQMEKMGREKEKRPSDH